MRNRADVRYRECGALSFAALLLASGAASASGTSINASCSIESDYDFALSEKSVILTRSEAAASPKTILMRQGRLFVDDRWVAVSDADRERLVEYEKGARATMPLAQKIGRDAAEIAFTAVGAVARGLSDEPAKVDAKLAQARRDLDRELATSMSATHFDGEDLGKSIGRAVQKVMPTIMGDITSAAMRAAFTGDVSRFEKLDNIDGQIDAIVAPRAKALEANAKLLCDRMHALDAIDDALAVRVDGQPLGLLRVAEKAVDDKDRDSDR